MVAWIYLGLTIKGDRAGPLAQAKNIVVTSTDKRWQDAKMPNSPTAVIDVVNSLGSEGWEMVNGGCLTAAVGSAFEATITDDRSYNFSAIFKRGS